MSIPDPDLPDVWQVRLGWTVNAIPMLNVIAVEDPTGTASTETVFDTVMDSLSEVLSSATGTTYRSFIDNSATLSSVKITRYDLDDPDTLEANTSGAQFTGTSNANALPPQVAMVVTLRAALASKRARGRIYQCGLTTLSTAAGGYFTQAAVDAVTAFWVALADEMSTDIDPLNLGILSRGWVNEGGGDTRPSFEQAFRQATTITVRDLVPDTQRRRAS